MVVSDTWESVLSGGGVAIFAFLLALLWDTHKSRRENDRRDRAIIVAGQSEVESLLLVVRNNQNLVDHELKLLDEDKRMINPLDPVQGGFWELVKINPPRVLLQKPDTLAQVREVARRTDQVNEMIRSREAFRSSNQALSSFNEQLRKYDELLHTFQAELLMALSALLAVFKQAQS